MVRYTANGCPSEDDEEHAVSDYCDLKKWKHTHFSNETYTTSWKQKQKMRYLGVHSGIPDHIVLIPNRVGGFYTVFVEMKRQKGGTISDEQYKWVHALICAGNYATVCEGAEEAIKYLDAIYNQDSQVIEEYVKKFFKKYEKWQKKDKKPKKLPKNVHFEENDCPF